LSCDTHHCTSAVFVTRSLLDALPISASVPVGLYSVRPAGEIEIGDLVAVLPPDDLATFLDARGYLPRGVPLIKRVLALPGTEVRSEEHTAELQSRENTVCRLLLEKK